MSTLSSTFGADPIPWVTDLWSGALDGKRSDVERSRAALAALDSIVAGLSDDDRTYSVRFSGDGLTTNTALTTKVVNVGHAPLADKALTSGQRAAIMTGLAFHEVGHIRHTRKVQHVLDSYGAKGTVEWKRAQRVLNLADDVRSERLNCTEFPGLAETLPIALRWVGERTISPGLKAATIKGPFNVAVMAVRYADFADWTGREATLAWWQAWAERAASAHTIPALRAVIDEALDRLAEPITEGDDTTDEQPDEPTEGGDESGDDESGDEPTEGGSDGDGEGSDGDGESDDATEGGEGDGDADDDEGDATEGGEGGEGTDEADGDGGDATEGGDGEGNGSDGEADGSDDPWQDEADGEAESGNGGGGHNPGDAPEQGSGQADGGEPTDEVEDFDPDADPIAPECPHDASTDGTEGAVQDGIDVAVSAQRSAQGVRKYTVDIPGYGQHTYEVKRGIPARRRGSATESEGMAFLPPTVGQPMKRATTTTKRPTLRVGVSQALAGALAASKRGDPMPTPGQRSGKLDRQRLARVASGDCRVFTNVVIPGPTRIRAIVLLDASGSMDTGSVITFASDGKTPQSYSGPTRATVAAQLGMDLAGAFDRMPNVKGAVYAHNVNDGIMVHALWQTGEPTDYVGDYADLALDSNADDFAIRYCTDDMLMARRPGEACVIVVVSDGMPSSTLMVKAAVDDARKRGVAVVSVAIAPEANQAQVQMYGHDDVVPYEPNPMVMARKIAQAIGRRV